MRLFRFCLPDLEYYINVYKEASDPERAYRFMEQTMLGQHARQRGVEGFFRSWLGGAQHRWMWDFPAMSKELEEVGFTDIRRAQFGDSEDPLFAAVEWKAAGFRTLALSVVNSEEPDYKNNGRSVTEMASNVPFSVLRS